MILVTGAGGKTGQAVVTALADRGAVVRALVRRAEDGPGLLALGAQEIAVGDMRQAADLGRAAVAIEPRQHPRHLPL